MYQEYGRNINVHLLGRIHKNGMMTALRINDGNSFLGVTVTEPFGSVQIAFLAGINLEDYTPNHVCPLTRELRIALPGAVGTPLVEPKRVVQKLCGPEGDC